MSTRWYPFYQKGNPQLRVYLPNFWMKLVKSESETRKNIVQFHCSMEMTKFDIKNYIEKIYKVPVIKVNTRIALGKTKRNPLHQIIKEEDIKVAYVHLPRYESFEFPNLFENEMQKQEKAKEEQAVDEQANNFKESMKEHDRLRPGLPSWFR